MTQEEIDALETSFRNQGLTWNQTNFAVAVIRNYVEPLRQQLDVHEANAKRFIEADKAMQKQLADSQKREAMLRKLVGEIYCSDESSMDVMRKIEDVLADIDNLRTMAMPKFEDWHKGHAKRDFNNYPE